MSQWSGRRGNDSRCGWCCLGLLLAVLSSAACGPSSTGPGGTGFVGKWQGTIVSDAIGAGTIQLSVTSEIGPRSTVLIAGTFTLSFSSPGFNVNGDFSGSAGQTLDQFGLFFDRSTVPCPDEPGGRADRALLGTMTVTNTRMVGRYVVAGCPGGSIDITRQ